MRTEQEILALYPPQQVGNQLEFDRAMNALRMAQTDEMKPLKQQVEAINQRRREIGRQMEALNIEMGKLGRERDEKQDELRRIGGVFHHLKRRMIQLNPKVAPQIAQM